MEGHFITPKNLIDIIDNTVLELKSVKTGKLLNDASKTEIISVLNFLINVTSEDYKRTLLYDDKAFFIEEKPLEALHSKMNDVQIKKEDIESLIQLINSKELLLEPTINEIQFKLIEVSIPLWNIIKKINNG